MSLIAVSRRNAKRAALLAGSSALALMFAGVPSAQARQFGNSSLTIAPPTIAADAATEAAQQAAKVAKQARDSMSRATQAIQAMQGAQAAARAAAQAAQKSTTLPTAVANGLGAGGLLPNVPAGWTGADRPTQAVETTGQTNVNINQTAGQAILNWTTFNVGARTTLNFDQHGNASWVALNRVDASTGPSQILGNIKADGIVLVINQSGIIFGGASQINVGSLIASSADITDAQFKASGIYSTQVNNIYVPSFSGAGDNAAGGLGGKVIVEQGAQITTNAPASVTQGGGYALLMGTEVDNAGSITTPKGQVEFAAGHDFILRPGLGTESNQISTTRGNEIAAGTWSGTAGTTGTWTPGGGTVTNTGIAFAQQGDITLAGHTIIQDGVLLSTTSVNQRGTIHLLNSASDASGSVTLTGNSLALILPELDSADTALNSQRDALIADSALENATRASADFDRFDNLSKLADREDQSRVEIVTGGNVVFKGGSLTQAQGGQVAVSAGQRVFTESGATIDVSGVQGVLLPMSSNDMQINVQGNDLRDSPQNRDSGNLANKDVWIDVRDLILVPAGTGGYATDRYYTPGGLLEVSGYLNNTTHAIGEWAALGGTITLSAAEVVAQQGSIFNISGGSLQYQGGYLPQTYVIGSDGGIYNINDAPSGIAIKAVANGFVVDHVHWGVTEIYQSPWGNKTARWEDGYTVGRDAGSLILSAATSLFAGDIVAAVANGERQMQARPSGVSDGYKFSQDVVALPGTLAVATYTTVMNSVTSTTTVQDKAATNSIVVTSVPAAQPGLADAIDANLVGTTHLDAGRLSSFGLGGLVLEARNEAAIDAPLTMAAGGNVRIVAGNTDIAANITARGGSLIVTNLAGDGFYHGLAGGASVTLEPGVTIDTRGLWTNALQDAEADLSRVAFVDGGAVTLSSTGDVALGQGSLIDASAGGWASAAGKIAIGKGGDISLAMPSGSGAGQTAGGNLVLDGTLRSNGRIGGALSLQASDVLLADAAPADDASGALLLTPAFFRQGFSAYNINGRTTLKVAPGTVVDVTEPVYQQNASTFSAPTGADPADVFSLVLNPLYLEDSLAAELTQRPGASLALSSGTNPDNAMLATGGAIDIGSGARLIVDPGQHIDIASIGQITIDGSLVAHGGSINVLNRPTITDSIGLNLPLTDPGALSIWIGSHATLDVSAQAYTAQDSSGRPYGVVRDGGSITLGSPDGLDATTDVAYAANAFIILRPGAVLNADGASAWIDPAAGTGRASNPIMVASNGGAIAMRSYLGIYNDASMTARSGGAGAAGGTLSLVLESPVYAPTYTPLPANMLAGRVLTIGEDGVPSGLSADLKAGKADASLVIGRARVSARQIEDGGFDNVSLWGRTAIVFDGDVSLHVGQSLSLFKGAIYDTSRTGSVSLGAPYVLLAGQTTINQPGDAFGYYSVPSMFTAPAEAARLQVTASLIDVRDTVRPLFADTALTSQGDLRFLASTNVVAGTTAPQQTQLQASGNLELTAEQVYPDTGAQAIVYAGVASFTSVNNNPRPNFDTDSVLSIRSVDGIDPALPYSVFGSITFYAPNVQQGGIVRAPLGSIKLGGVPGLAGADGTHLVELLPGSITSVSANGLVMPYGGTTDGVTYTVNGSAPLAPNLFSGELTPGISSGPVTGVTLNGVDIRSDAGSLLDLSGGGTLAGAAFVTGRGGSVDVLTTAMANANPTNTYSAGGNQVYAIVPGARTAPTGATYYGAWNGNRPAIGQQITIGSGVPGLPAGTYTLMPADYALLPGAFRVELGGQETMRLPGVVSLPSGSYVTDGVQGVANTAIRDALATRIIVTSGATVRTQSTYNEQSYDAFQLAQAATFGTLRALLPRDGKFLTVSLNPLPATTAPMLDDGVVFRGGTNMASADDGFGGYLVLTGAYGDNLVITGPGSSTLRSSTLTTVSAASIDAVGAPNLYIGQAPLATMTISATNSKLSGIRLNGGSGPTTIELESGANLVGSQIVLTVIPPYGGVGSIVLDSGSSISTLGRGVSAPGLETGYLVDAGSTATLVATNGELGFLAFLPSTYATSSITIQDGASVYAEGSLNFLASGVNFAGAEPRIGARRLDLALPWINIGNADVLAAAATGGILPAGLNLDQALLDRLLNGDPASGAPAVEQFTLSASSAINFYGSASLDARGGHLQELVFESPAIYGYGTSGDVVNVSADTLVWNGATTTVTSNYVTTTVGAKPGALIPGGPGTGQGQFNLNADRIVFGYPSQSQPDGTLTLDRLMLGFTTVNFNAGSSITANNKGTLSVYAGGPDPSADFDPAHYAGTGGDLNFNTPLLTADSGAVIAYRAGGALRVAAPSGSVAAAVSSLGGEIDLSANTIAVDSSIALPSGRLVMTAANDITLGGNAQLDLAGRAVGFFDVTQYTWGGDVQFETTHGNIVVQAGSVIDVSGARDANGVMQSDAGSISLTATDASQGAVLLGATLLGYGMDAGEGAFDIRAQRIGIDAGNLTSDFAALNAMLDAGGFYGSRSFDLKQGSLAIGSVVKAHAVEISVDGGSLTVGVVIDASGAAPGSIRLAARDDLTLLGSALLDVHGTVLQVDGYGQPVEAKNRGTVELTTTAGTLGLQAGATIDLTSPGGVARGQIELNAPRTGETSGDIQVSAGGPLTIRGAQSIALNGFWSYSPTDAAGTIEQDNGGTAPVGADGAVGMKQIDQRSQQFITAALANNDLTNRIAGLSSYGVAFHLRPGVEINSADTPNGNLTVKGDIDLASYRYGPNADRDAASATYGAGEPMSLVTRASGNLNINGSISDGFGPGQSGIPAVYGGEIAAGSSMADFPTLFANLGDILHVGEVVYLLRVDLYLTADWTVPTSAAYQANGGTYDVNGRTYAPGTVVPAGTQLRAQWAIFAADTALPGVATSLVSPATPAKPATSVLAPMLASGSMSSSIRLVAGADLGAADTRVRQPLGNLPFRPTSQSFGGLTDVVSSPDFSLTSFGPGLDGYYNTASATFYFAEDWTFPDTAFYRALLPNGVSGLDGHTYHIGDTIPAGTAFTASNMAFDPAAAIPELGTSTTIVPAYTVGSIMLSDSHVSSAGNPMTSVIRTGTGSLELLAAGDLIQSSLFGIYTAGTQVEAPAGYAPLSGSYYVDHGGNLLVSVQGNLGGFAPQGIAGPSYNPVYSNAVSNWLVANTAPDGTGTWSIRFGANATDGSGVLAFSGFGALGGGNVTLEADGDAGLLRDSSGGAIVAAVGSSGYVASLDVSGGIVTGGKLSPTGGGDLTVRIGGRLNPGAPPQDANSSNDSANGDFIDVRGGIDIMAGAIGIVPLTYDGSGIPNDPRGPDPYAPTYVSSVWGGPVVVPGDGQALLRTRGDLALGGVGNPAGNAFSLWLPDTAVRLFSAGGNLVPYNGNIPGSNEISYSRVGTNYLLLPPILQAVAASGSIFSTASNYNFELLSSPEGNLEFLAQDSIYGLGSLSYASYGRWDVSGATADPNSVSSPFKPGSLLDAFRPDDVTNVVHAGDFDPMRLYAVNGDITNFALGEQYGIYSNGIVSNYNVAAKSVEVRAGRDIVNFGNSHAQSGAQVLQPGVIMNANDTDVSVISAGRDIFYTDVLIAGPGTLDISAGRNFYQGANGLITSIGPIATSDERLGAGVAVQVGAGAAGPDWSALAAAYLNPANQADLTPGHPLADQPGKVAHTYQQELIAWLESRYGYEAAGVDDALAYFATLAPEQQHIFLRTVYYAELRAGGREYNDPDSSRFGSYLRGREMIATLFPDTDAAGNPIARGGDFTQFGGSGIQTEFGGDIQMLVPAGQTLIGVEGTVPPATSGLLTQGQGDIALYSKGSILLGLSRIMTTFGGSILAWSAEGDINAGRGAKTTVVYTPPKRVTDNYGRVTLSPTVPSSGAGIATLAPIPEVPAGDIDLIAPLGTIDAGEAGIRVSGNVNLAALQVLNAANIQVQGTSAGLPTVQGPPVAALTSASNTAAATQQSVQPAAGSNSGATSVMIVEIIGYGGGDGSPDGEEEKTRRAPERQGYDPNSMFQVVGSGPLSESQRARLTADEQQRMSNP